METNKTARKPFHIQTPLLESVELSKIVGFPTYLKCENCQPSGSFKLRGIGHFVQKSYEDGVRSVVIASGGNAGLATAYSASKLGISATVVIPESTPIEAVTKLSDLGAQVVIHGQSWDDSNEEALRIASLPGNTYVHPFDDPLVWEGHTSMMAEVKEQLGGAKPRCVVVAVGGGGLLTGVIQGLQKNGWNDVPVIAMETVGAASFHGAVKARKLITLPKIDSIAVCLGARTVARRALDLVVNDEHTILPHLVTDSEALEACFKFLDHHRMLVEPACGAGLAAVYSGIVRRADEEGFLLESGPAVVIVCGGASVTVELLAKWKASIEKEGTNGTA